jgi:hypothetical protein
MRKVLLFILLALGIAAAQHSNTHDLITLTTLSGVPALNSGGCPATGHTSNSATPTLCPLIYYVMANVQGDLGNISAVLTDLGTSGPSFTGFNTASTVFALYSPGYAVTSISNNGTTTTAAVSGNYAVWEPGDVIYCIGCPGTYANAWTVTGTNYAGTGSGNLVSLTWAQGGSPPSCSSNCGRIATACAGQACRQEIGVSAATNAPQNFQTPTYPFSQAWANTACAQSPWIASASIPPHWCIWVPSVGHFYHSLSVADGGNNCSTGLCVNGSTAPTWNVAGGTTTSGTVIYQDDGTTNAFPLEIVVGITYTGCTAGTGLGGCTAPITAGVYNVNSTNCGVSPFTGGTQQCTAAMIAQGFPINWEQPWVYWFNLYHDCYDGDTLNSSLQCPGPTHTGNPGVIFYYANTFAGASQIDYIREGCDAGGECFIWEYADIEAAFGWTDLSAPTQLSNVWSNGANKMYAAAVNSWKQTSAPWHVMFTVNMIPPTCTTTSCTQLPVALAANIASYNPILYMGSQGLQGGDQTALAAGEVTSNDWVAMFRQYYSEIPVYQLQTSNQSEVPGYSTVGNCNSAQIQTGSLAAVVPFGMQHYANFIELYIVDTFAAFNPNFTNSGLCVPYSVAQAVNYAGALTNVALGQPNSTGGLMGKAGKIGTAGKQ